MNAKDLYSPLVQDLMTADPISLTADDDVKTLRDLMESRHIRHVPVTDSKGRLAGLITHRDFLTIAVSRLAHVNEGELDELYRSIKLKDVMGRKVVTTSADTPLEEAASIMRNQKFGCLPVIEEDGTLVGILTEADFLKAFLERDAHFA